METSTLTFSKPRSGPNPLFATSEFGIYHSIYPNEKDRTVEVLSQNKGEPVKVQIKTTVERLYHRVNLNNSEDRETLWENKEFREALAVEVGKIVAKHQNDFWDGEHTFCPEVITDFFTADHGHHEYFLLGCLWLDMERYVYYPDLNRKHAFSDACCNAWSDFSSEPSRYTENPEPCLEATYY